jgi:hypothetical protein
MRATQNTLATETLFREELEAAVQQVCGNTDKVGGPSGV